MNRIVLIGNGFDLAHGLATRYEDFINWYWERRKNILLSHHDNRLGDKLCEFILRDTECSTWSCFLFPRFYEWQKMSGEEFLSEILRYREVDLSSAPFLDRICLPKRGWMDIEADYYDLLKECIKLGPSEVVILHEQLEYLQELLFTYLDKIQKENINNNLIIPEIKAIFEQNIIKEDISVNALNSTFASPEYNDGITLSDTLVLNFNYTKTAELYTSHVNHIHGVIDNSQSVIFGYGDEMDKHYQELEELNDNKYLTHIKSFKYLNANNYRSLLEFIESEPYQIYIMGHSCANSDRTLLNTLFEHENCVSIKPFYYQKEDGTDNYTDIVQNISRNFKDKKLLRDRVVNKTYCEPMPQAKLATDKN